MTRSKPLTVIPAKHPSELPRLIVIAKNSRTNTRSGAWNSQQSKSSNPRPQRIPKEKELRRKLDDLHGLFIKKVKANDLLHIAELNRLIDLLTGGKLEIRQCGERRKGKGWLEGSCPFLLKKYLLNEQGFQEDVDNAPDKLHFNFRVPTKVDQYKEQIFELYEKGLMIKEIATQLKLGYSTVETSLRRSYREKGLPPPHKKTRKQLHAQRPENMPQYKAIAPTVLQNLQEGFSYGEIARRHKVNRTQLKKTFEFLKSQGHTIPDGRGIHSGRQPYKNNLPPAGGDEAQT
jgi:hypothetical protein